MFRQGVPPHATYLFKHALVQDAAYGTLLREPRRALHARIAETIEKQFAEIAENQPEVLARHCTEAGLIEKAAGLWGKAGQRSLARRPSLKRQSSSSARLPRLPPYRQRQHSAANRSSFRSRSRTLWHSPATLWGSRRNNLALAIYNPAQHRPLTTRFAAMFEWSVGSRSWACGYSVIPWPRALRRAH